MHRTSVILRDYLTVFPLVTHFKSTGDNSATFFNHVIQSVDTVLLAMLQIHLGEIFMKDKYEMKLIYFSI